MIKTNWLTVFSQEAFVFLQIAFDVLAYCFLVPHLVYFLRHSSIVSLSCVT